MKGHILIGAAFVGVALVVMFGASEKPAIAQAQKRVLPIFAVDANFPTMPEHMEMGGVGGVNADSHGNVWVFQRPHTIEDGNSMDNGYKPAPPVLEFDAKGNYIQGWGGPSKTANTSGRTAEGCIPPMQSAPLARSKSGPMATDVPGAASMASRWTTKTTSG